MPWLYDGVPDHPARLREWVLRFEVDGGLSPVERVQRKRWLRNLGTDKSTTRDLIERPEKGGRSTRRLRWMYRVLTAPAVTFGMTMVSAPLLALQLDRTFDGEGNWSVALGAAGMLSFAAWMSAARAAVVDREVTRWNDAVDRERLDKLEQNLQSDISNADMRHSQALEEIKEISLTALYEARERGGHG